MAPVPVPAVWQPFSSQPAFTAAIVALIGCTSGLELAITVTATVR